MNNNNHRAQVLEVIKLWNSRKDPKKYLPMFNAIEASYLYCVYMPDDKVYFGYFLDDLIFRYNTINQSDISIDEVQKLLVLL